MPLASGTRLGPYEVQSPLGEGGMGEVYRALDTRLDRTVAIKILPSHLSENPDARQRFDREARTISSLNHPNICVLYDVGHQDGIDFLVMEYLEGETLEDRLRKGPLPLAQVLKCGIEICDGLEKAHRSGIVHRDLKPGNVMLTKSGTKLMDFGLAKTAVVPTKTSSGLTMTLATPMGSHPLTAEGTVIGTFQYMAPEQVEGKEADARSDIFALGAVIYEMATAHRAFEGKTAASAMAAVLERDPSPISSLQPTSPAALDHVVHECLAKDPEARWQSAADIARQLRWIAATASGVGAAAAMQRKPVRRPQTLVWAAVVAVLLAALAWSLLRSRESAPPLHAFLPPPPQMSFDFTGDFSGPPAFSPDGSSVAFCARTSKERNAVWVHSLSELASKKLEGTEGASFPFWSADGKFIAFFADDQLKKIPAAGGPVTILATAPNPRGGSWTQDNFIVYEPDYRDTLWRINAAGGTPVRLTSFEGNKHTTHRWPQILPDGKHFLFFATNHSGDAEHGIYFGNLSDGSYRHLIDSDAGAQYASGYLLYHLQSQLLAQKFDPSSGTLSGESITVANLVEYDIGTWHASFSASANGLLVYEPGSKTLGSDLFWMDLTGKTLGKIGDRGFYKGAGRISPDGKRLAVSMGDPQADIWVFDLVRGSQTRLTFGGGTHLEPSWSADGERIFYIVQSGTTVMTGTSIRSRLANGGGQEEVLLESGPNLHAALLSPQLSPDGCYLVHLEQEGPSRTAVWILPMTGDKKPVPIVQAQVPQARIVQYRLSPNGRWLAYSSTDSGREEVYVTHFPSGQGRWQVSQNGGTFPAWRADGKEIWYDATDSTLHAAAVNPNSEEFEMEPMRSLFQINYVTPVGVPYDVSPDGRRIVVSVFPENLSTPLVLVTNWPADLKK